MAAQNDESLIARYGAGSRVAPLAIDKDPSQLAAQGSPGPLPIVAIGASAGGLKAVSRLLDLLPPSTGMAFILVQHLDPTHKSLMVDLLGEHTAMAVVEAADGRALAPDHIYVIPPGRYLSLSAGVLHLSAQQVSHGARLPFDFLLGSLAKDCGDRTACVVLSGTGGDGSGGIPAFKAAGGQIFAQQPEEAEYDGMPRSAIATGLVGRILPLGEIARALADFGTQVSRFGVTRNGPTPAASTGLSEIISFLKDNTLHDFRQYKPGTLERRIARRMALLTLARSNFAAYLELLRQEPAERDLLANDLLINVTSFFRDPKVFEALATTIIPEIIQALPIHQSLRIWVAGCSTGEEAYSLAMICCDAIAASGRKIELQVFASDVDPDAIALARDGFYPGDIAGVVTADRLARYFIKDEAGYRIATTLRGLVVFTVQNVLSDPPFSRIDLISCRNLLIYLNHEAQAKVISTFDFALREGGILVLGPTETVGSPEGKFAVIAKSERFYRHIARSRVGELGFPEKFGDMLPVPGNAVASAPPTRQATLAEICSKAILASHAPAAVLINRERRFLYSLGRTDRYLRVAPGYATFDLLAMATPALRTKLRLAIDKVSTTTPHVDGGRMRLTQDGVTIWFKIEVQALAGDHEDLLLICFVEDASDHAGVVSPGGGSDATRIAELELELEATQAELQSSILSRETSSQEQQTINEEALSVNEEFQSTNEELLTSKEELQSLNEELTALNNQLQETLERQRLASDDLQNVLYSTNVGTLFLDTDLNIRFYTPAIKSLFSIIAGDIGRPLADLRPIATDQELLRDARRVLTDEDLIEREIYSPNDTWFLRRIFPYRTHNGRVEGVVITFADITERKLIANALGDAKLEAERANLAKSRFLAAASHDLRQPLQSLTLLQELLVQSVEGEQPRKLLARLEQTLEAMSGMLNALLDINQIESGVVQAKPGTFAIATILDRLRDEFAYLAQAHNLSMHILSSTAVVDSDPKLLEQMIRNLLGNAIKYTRHGKILLGCRRRGNTMRIEVWDTGIGIAADELHAIFDEFHQVDNDARERSLGLGLGLTIVQRLGRLLGHEVDVRSMLGKGSVFTVTVSRAFEQTSEPTNQVPSAIPAGEEAKNQRKIIIVDDDPDVLQLLGQLLKANGHIVRTAADAASALKLIAGGAIRPEILLTDYNLPGGMNGLELLAQLRTSLPYALPAIILTGDISTEALARITGQDCVQLSKPVKPHELVAVIKRLSPKITPIPSDGVDVIIDVASFAYVIDDSAEDRATIRAVLESDGRVVEDFASAEAFLKSYRPGREGCLLIDAYLTGMSGIALLEELRARGDHIPAILITGSGDVGLAVAAMRTGACDFIEKPVGRQELLASITRAIGQSHDIRLVDALHEDAAAHVADLTSRQREVMDMVLAGHPSKNIAADLGISQRTVENHRATIMTKMGAKSVPELARTALAAGARAVQAGTSLEPKIIPASIEVLPRHD